HDPDADEHLADGLPGQAVEHGRVGASEDQGEERHEGLEALGRLEVDAREPDADELERRIHDEQDHEIDADGERANPEARGTRPNHGAYNIAMISVRDGQNQILHQLAASTPPELVAVTRARERVLAEDLLAPFDVPPTDNSAVDGY